MKLVYKKCTSCKKNLPLSDYWKEKEGKYGVKSQCKKCHYKYRKKNRKKIEKVREKTIYSSKKYKEGDCIEIYFCKDCGCLLPVSWPGKHVIRKYYNKTYGRCHCGMCDGGKKISWHKSYERKLTRNAIREDRRNWYYCPVCGQPHHAEGGRYWFNGLINHPEYDEYYHPEESGCVRGCREKIKYAQSFKTRTGIIRNRDAPPIYECRIEDLEEINLNYQFCSFLKRSDEEEELYKSTVKELKNVINRRRNQRIETTIKTIGRRESKQSIRY